MKRLQKKKTNNLNCQTTDIGTEKKICYVCGKPIKETQRFYAIGKDKKGKELYRHIKCRASDYKERKNGISKI